MGIRGKKISAELSELLCDKYRNGISLKEIATKSHISETTLMAILRRNNIPLRNGKRLSPEQEDRVVVLYKSGEAILKIMAETGIKSEQTIYRILRDAGIEKRRKRDPSE